MAKVIPEWHPLPVQTAEDFLTGGETPFIVCHTAIEVQKMKQRILNAGLKYFPPINDGSATYLRPYESVV